MIKLLPKYGYGFKIDTLDNDNTKSDNNIDMSFLNDLLKKSKKETNTANNKTDILPVNNITFKSNGKKTKVDPQDIANLLYENGFNKTATLGILGNIQGESNFNPDAVGDGGTSIGLFQHHNQRARGLKLGDWYGQTKRAISEISPSLKRRMNNARDIYESTRLFTREFERPANPESKAKERGKYANEMNLYIKAYGGNLKKKGFGDYLGKNPDVASMGLGFLGTGVDSMNNGTSPDLKLSALSGALKGAGTGASIGSVIPGVGTAIGAGVGAIVGGVSSLIKGQKEKKEIARTNKLEQTRFDDYNKIRSNQIMSAYPSNGIQGQTSFLAKGGDIEAEYEVEKNEVVKGNNVMLQDGKQLASDMHKVGGKIHEQGGTKGAGGDVAYSNRLNAPYELIQTLKNAGIPTKEKSTIADIATFLGKKKGIFEDKIKTKDYIKQNTGKMMIGKIDQLLDLTFQTQESMKEVNPEIQRFFAYGGNLPKLAYGGNRQPKRPSRYGNALPAIDNVLGSSSWVDKQTVNNRGEYLNNKDYINNTNNSFSTPIYNSIQAKTYHSPYKTDIPKIDFAKVSADLSTIKQPIEKKLDTSSLIGYGTSTLGFLADRNSINKMKTTVNRNLIEAPNFNYQDRSRVAKDDVAQDFRNLINNRTLNPVMKQLAFAQKLKATSDINARENINKDSYINNFNDRAFRVNANNVAINNDANDTERQLYNQNQSMYMSNRNNFLGNVQTVQRENNVRKYQGEQLDLIRETNNLKTNGGANYQLDMLKKKKANGTITKYESDLLDVLS